MILRAALTLMLVLTAPLALAETRVPQSQAEISLGFAPLVRQAAPAVVNIYAKRITQARSPSPFEGDPFFENFFRDFGPPRARVQNSLGSGVILSADGIVVSNYHVVGMATEIRVVLSDRREFSAQVLLGDQSSDLAILKLDGAGALPYLPLRDSDSVEVGELVLAIGNPFGVGQTVSSGIVSGLARSGAATGNARGYFIQTDAPINPGNSGGALIDIEGRMIGINTSILTRSGGSNGIGFAIPADLVAQFVAQARQGKTAFERPWAGMMGQPVDAELADSLGLTIPEGLVVSQLHRFSPFLQAGVEVGDVITAVGGQPVNSPSEMVYRMSVTGLGKMVAVDLVHRGVARRVEVSLIPAPDDPPRLALVLDDRTVLPGLELARANPAVIAEMGLPLVAEGVIVTDPGPVGARAGFKPGDQILEIDGKPVAVPQDVADTLSDPGWRVSVVIQRGGQRIALRFRL